MPRAIIPIAIIKKVPNLGKAQSKLINAPIPANNT